MSDDTPPVEEAVASAPPSIALTPSGLWQLLFQPTKFFTDARRLMQARELPLLAWLAGISYAMDRIDSNLLKDELGAAKSSSVPFGSQVLHSWSAYWLFVLGGGVISGCILWFLGAWWYSKRLNWSGASAADWDDARPLYLYQSFVAALPVLVITLLQTVQYSSYLDAWQADELWSSVSLVFLFWSCVTSYKAALTAYPVTLWKARLWFLILPIGLYILVFGGAAALFAAKDS